MKIRIEYDTTAIETAVRLEELREKGTVFTARPVRPDQSITLRPDSTQFYVDGYETTTSDLTKLGIPRDGYLPGVFVKTDIDMLLYSAPHNQCYYFARHIEFKRDPQNKQDVLGSFI